MTTTRLTSPPALVVALGDHIDDGLLLVDSDGRVELANNLARTLLRLQDDCVGRLVEDIGCDYRVVLLLAECAASGGTVERDLDQPLDERELRAFAFPVSDGQKRCFVLLLRDRTRVRRLETMRRDFVANVSHELRTPVAAIQLLVETLQNGAIDDRAAAAEFVSKIRLEVAHMGHMLEELLQLSAIESGMLPLRAAPVEVERLIAAIERLRPLAVERRLQLRSAVDPGTPDVAGDSVQLEHVLRNLVHNAIKFTPPGGSVTVNAQPLEGGASVELSVSDTGIGIVLEDVERIFERFWKADRSRSRDGEGSGLGLAIARHVVELYGGAISVRLHHHGPGVTFVVTLPASNPG